MAPFSEPGAAHGGRKVTAAPGPPFADAAGHVGRGRLTKGQRRALERLWPSFGVAAPRTPLDFDRLFGRRGPCRLDIGFGMGDALLDMAGACPQANYLGVELYLPGIGSALMKLEQGRLDNVRLVYGDAGRVLSEGIPAGSLETVSIFFPDPWPKKRHHKRRLVQPPFSRLIADALRPGGCLYVATDWEDYAAHMLRVLEETPGLINAAGAGRFAPRPPERPTTKFERRGRRLGHDVRDLVFTRR